jgi:general secretion pathway protein H
MVWPTQVRGVTLVELVVAITIAALLLAVVPASLSAAHETFAYRAFVRELVAGLRLVRSQAMQSGREVRFVIDVEGRRWGGDQRMRDVPARVDMDAVVAQSEVGARGIGAIRFYPDGSSTGGTIVVVRQSRVAGVRLRVDWMLGRVSQEPFVGTE